VTFASPKSAAQLPAYIVNRHVRITAKAGKGGTAWLVEAPIRGQGLRTSTIEPKEMLDIHQVFEALSSNGERQLTLDAATVITLVDLGVLVPAEHDAEAPRFSVRLDASINVSPAPADKLRVNPRIRLTDAYKDDCFEVGRTIEVFDAMRGIDLPYWMDDEQAATIAAVSSGRRTLSSLAPATIAMLHAAYVVEDASCAMTETAAAESAAAVARRHIAADGYAVLPAVLPPLYVRALQRHFRERIARGFLSLGDAQSSRRFIVHNDPVSVWLHARLCPAVDRLLPISVRPSYTYLVSYLEGADLPRHTDREQCEYTLSLAVDAWPDVSRAGAWPLHLQMGAENATVSVSLAPGDAVLFAGRRLAHFRDPLPMGSTSTSLLLHFVADSFVGSLS
jgi:hypothetical protein